MIFQSTVCSSLINEQTEGTATIMLAETRELKIKSGKHKFEEENEAERGRIRGRRKQTRIYLKLKNTDNVISRLHLHCSSSTMKHFGFRCSIVTHISCPFFLRAA